jgi:branched-chain amino acid transport system ATP-binding protein
VGTLAADILATEQHAAAAHREQPDQGPHQGALADAVAPEHADDLAAADLDADALQHVAGGIAGAQLLGGEDVSRERADLRARRGIGYVPQGREIFPQMTVLDNLRMGTLINAGRAQPDFDLVYGTFPFLRERRAQRGGTLSGGQQEMLAIARALINRPEVVLLDEPSDGVQPSIVEEIGDILVGLNRERGLTALIVEQNIDLVQRVAARAYVLDKGRVVRALDADALRNTEQLARFLAI